MVRNDSGVEGTASSDICWGKGEKSLFGHIDTTNRELPYGTIFQTHNGVKTLMCFIWRCVLISSLSRTLHETIWRTRASKWHICLTGAGAEERCAVPTKSDQSRDLILYMYSDYGLNTDVVWWGEWACIVRLKDKTKSILRHIVAVNQKQWS